jgi:Bax protein
LDALKREYKVNKLQVAAGKALEILARRVDIVPTKLALVQAANESGWGTSRFARLGNNIFGQWCFSSTCGLIPDDRDEGATHRVASFGTVNESVRKYIRNINTHPAYIQFRKIRFQQRQAGDFPNAHDLAAGLINYSARGHEYVTEMRTLLRINEPLLGG